MAAIAPPWRCDRGTRADELANWGACRNPVRRYRRATSAAMAELVDATVLGTVGQPWGFESL